MCHFSGPPCMYTDINPFVFSCSCILQQFTLHNVQTLRRNWQLKTCTVHIQTINTNANLHDSKNYGCTLYQILSRAPAGLASAQIKSTCISFLYCIYNVANTLSANPIPAKILAAFPQTAVYADYLALPWLVIAHTQCLNCSGLE